MLFCPFVGGVNLHLGLIVPVCGLVGMLVIGDMVNNV